MSENSAGYRKIFKGTAVFGGVQVFQIFISLVRGKIVALFLGPEGMGISGLYTSSLAMLITIAGLGCSLSAVRYISILEKDSEEYFKQINITKIIFLGVALFGFLLTMAFAFPLSVFTFENKEHIVPYMFLALYVFFSLYNQGQTAILQAMQELRAIALGNVLPSFIVLLAAVPLYYFLRLKAIVPMLILTPFVCAVYMQIAIHLRLRENSLSKTKPNFQEIFRTTKEFLGLGIVTLFVALMANLSTYLQNAFVSRVGSFSDIGLYNAGTSITNQYIGLVFTAISVDYFPRLTSVSADTDKMNQTINSQGEIVTLMCLPILSLMMVTAPLCIKILLSDEFWVINGFIRIMAYGMLFKAAEYCFSLVALAKGDKKTFFFLDGLVCSLFPLVANCLGYKFYGLKGLSIASCAVYIIYFFVIALYARIKYGVIVSKGLAVLVTVAAALLAALLFLTAVLEQTLPVVLAGSLVAALVCAYSLRELNKRMKVVELIKAKLKKLAGRA